MVDIDDTIVGPDAVLPLTCSRSGTCCHGKAIWLNPWELAYLALGRGMSSRSFRDAYTVDGGLRLRVDGPAGWLQLPQCSQYDAQRGCTVHTHRPLACRLFPLGRRRQADQTVYFHEGRQFPCLLGCPEVVDLPRLTVAEYCSRQEIAEGETAQDIYLDIMQDLAEGALVLLIDSGLAACGDEETLQRWRAVTALNHVQRAASLSAEWFDALSIPEGLAADNAREFAYGHRQQLQQRAQDAFSRASTPEALCAASTVMMTLSLHIGATLQLAASDLVERWAAIAREHGARDSDKNTVR